MQDMKLFVSEMFFRYFRMTPTTLETLLSWVAPLIVKKETNLREPISANERLCVRIKYPVTGDVQVTIAANYCTSPAVVGRIIYETSLAIWDALHAQGYLSAPNSEDDWKRIAHEFQTKWNFPNALGAIDGKHVVMPDLVQPTLIIKNNLVLY